MSNREVLCYIWTTAVIASLILAFMYYHYTFSS